MPKRRVKRQIVRRKRIKKRRQRGGAVFRSKPTLTDKIAERMSMFLSGPSPTFATLGGKLASQVFKEGCWILERIERSVLQLSTQVTMSSPPPINIIVSLLCKANQKIDELNDKCAGLEKKCDYWKGEYKKYSRIGNVAMKYILCQDCLDQNTHEGQTVEICETCTDKLKTLHNAKAEVEYWKNQMQEESERADHWHKCYNDKRTKYLTLVEKIQCEGCKLNKYDYDKYCSECIKSREKSKK
ncbi:hypothetical protein OS493_036574 [Desmophyllum pertusum]|uniref:Uncharacterized protein n=1 Tax=Desmophyllum pertusum TaxID=174260 RepID=A0A9W9Y7B6_9CNID|nr:hypothetical protein OS493_036574 [Desmophyllum pertusum]